nr:ribonuclease H-like domain-containing protein [Tanacetum cinerariifolium]
IVDDEEKKDDNDKHDDAKDDDDDNDDHDDKPLINTRRSDLSRHTSSKHIDLIGIGQMEEICEALREKVPQLTVSTTSDRMKEALPRLVTDVFNNERESSRATIHALISQEFAARAPKMKSDLQSQVANPELWSSPKAMYEKSAASTDSCRKPAKESNTLVSKQPHQQELDASVYIPVIDEDEDMNTKEKKYVLSLNKIHVTSFPEEDLKEKMIRWLGIESYQIKIDLTAPTLTFPHIEACNPYSIVDEPLVGLIYLNKKEEKRIIDLVDISKFYEATLEKARTTLLLSLPDDHQLRFSKYKTARELWAIILKTFVDKFWKRTGKKISIQGSDVAGFDKSKVECFNCHKMGHFARECRAPKSQERGRRESYRQGSKAKEKSSKALMAINRIGWDWSYMANKEDHALVADGETPIEFALMANIEIKVFDNSLCSKDCKKNTDSLNSKINELKNELSESNTYRTLEMYKESNLESIKILKNEVETLKEEKDVVDGKLARLLKSSKDLENIIESQRSKKVKEGVGYNVVPPLAADLYLFPKKDLSWTGLPEYVNDTVTDYSRPSPTVASTSAEDQNKDTSTYDDVASTNPSKPFVKFVKPKDSQPESKSKEQETPKKSQVKYPKQNRHSNKRRKGNQRNWNNLKSYQLGPEFVLHKKPCYNCGDFSHLANDCRRRVQRETNRSQNHSYKSSTHRSTGHRPNGAHMRPPHRSSGPRPHRDSMRPTFRPAGHRPHGPSMNP